MLWREQERREFLVQIEPKGKAVNDGEVDKFPLFSLFKYKYSIKIRRLAPTSNGN